MIPATLQEVLSASRRVQRSVGSLLAAVGIAQPRMSDLRERFGFDKSVASRIARAVRSKDAGAALRELPGTEVLERLVAGCASRGAASAAVDDARIALQQLDAAVAAFPGDRTALASALAGVGPSGIGGGGGAVPVSRARLRAARRGAYNAFLFAQGMSCETQACVTMLAPGRATGEEPGVGSPRADQAMVMSSTGLRRLRPGRPFAVLSVQGRPGAQEGYDRTSLEGRPVADDPSIALLPEFCSPSAAQLRLERRGRFHSLVLDPHLPPLDEPMDLAYGLVNPNFTSCVANDDDRWSMTSFTVARPTRIFVREVLLHRATFPDVMPEAVFSIETVPPARPEADGPDRTGRGFVDHGEEFVAMGAGYRKRGKPGQDFAVPMAWRAFELRGWNPDDFERFRMVVEYPLPFVRCEAWVRLPEPA